MGAIDQSETTSLAGGLSRGGNPKGVQLGSMTMCMAAQCLGRGGEPLFLLCTDGRLDAGSGGFDDSAYKAHLLGYNYLALMAGHWSPVRRLCATIEQGIVAQALPEDALALADAVSASVKRFCGSELCKRDSRCELIITGFSGKRQEPTMLLVGVDDREYTIDEVHDVWMIGEGSDAASMLLKHRGYDPLNTRIEKACYLTYEAKRFAESVSSVGPRTRLKVHAPIAGRDPVVDDLNEHDITAKGMDMLEEMRLGFFLQSIPKHFDPFPHSYFTHARGLLGPE